MIEFEKINFNDAIIKDIRIDPVNIEIDYIDWQEKGHTLIFCNQISLFSLSPHGKALSHGELESHGSYLIECCEATEEESVASFMVFNFVDAWGGRKILRIVAERFERVSHS
ncbi:hypothetical protein [Noviherbaspirillum galbum]|uniref:Uncharacterized protein n=1 Tax=Noviherbaspirillum galbum TaxID=2709383 RepID=A0A6B3SZM6_9BURK|nr:hypothetical protein [Noviherbaspirillum galbum]NEX64912.1 hypothetical protein [Noviherbaspirillum galbum]